MQQSQGAESRVVLLFSKLHVQLAVESTAVPQG